MSTVEPGALIPDALAAKLAGHYASSATSALAALHWTGRVQPGAAREVEQAYAQESVDGRRDSHAVAAELRALAHYCRHHAHREAVEGWRSWTPAKGDEAAMVVPWAWRER
jgi:hypothetical protein